MVRRGEERASTPIKAPIFLGGPITLVAPGLEIGLGPVGQEHSPCCFEVGPRLVERIRGAAPVFARMRARIEASIPLPWISIVRVAGADRDRADANVAAIDMPALFGGIEGSAAGEDGHSAIGARSGRAGNSTLRQ